MPTQEALKHVIRQVALGDEAATEAFAQFLDQRIDTAQAQAQASAEQVTAQQVEAHYLGKEAYRKKVEAMRREYPVLDKENDPEAFALAAKIDSQLVEKYPHLSEDERLERAAKLTSKRLGDPQERDYESAIAKMQKARTGHATEQDNEIRFNEDADPVNDEAREVEADRADAIAEMAAGRRGFQAPQSEDPPKARRRFPFMGR